MYLPRESKLVAPALHMTSHGIRSVWMPRCSDQWIDSLKASSVFYIVLIAPDVPAPSIRLVDDTLTSAVDLLDTVRKSHLVWVGAVGGRRLCGSEEARSTFACVPVCHAAGSPLHKRRIKRGLVEILPAKNWHRVAIRVTLCRCQYFCGSSGSSEEEIVSF